LAKTQQTEKTVRSVVNYRVCELAIVLWLLVVTIHKCSVNSISNPNPVYRHINTRDNIMEIKRFSEKYRITVLLLKR
jgi:hypothetical protein